MEEKDMMQQEEQEQSSTPVEASTPENTPENELGLLKAELAEQKEKFIRLYAEFDNFKRRNAKERVELIQTAGREVIQAMLEVVDDCERAEKQMQKTDDLGQV